MRVIARSKYRNLAKPFQQKGQQLLFDLEEDSANVNKTILKPRAISVLVKSTAVTGRCHRTSKLSESSLQLLFGFLIDNLILDILRPLALVP